MLHFSFKASLHGNLRKGGNTNSCPSHCYCSASENRSIACKTGAFSSYPYGFQLADKGGKIPENFIPINGKILNCSCKYVSHWNQQKGITIIKLTKNTNKYDFRVPSLVWHQELYVICCTHKWSVLALADSYTMVSHPQKSPKCSCELVPSTARGSVIDRRVRATAITDLWWCTLNYSNNTFRTLKKPAPAW